MEYRIEIYDTWGRRVARLNEAPLLEVVRTTPEKPDRIRGLLPPGLNDLSPGYRVWVFLSGRRVCEASVIRVAPQWSDARKLILDRYVHFHEVIEFEAERPPDPLNTSVSRPYLNRTVSAIVKDAINRAAGPVHYRVNHGSYPDGARREYQKFLARKTADNELEFGGISSGQWVGSSRIDAGEAYAKDGDTIAGLVVDGIAWPDLRLLLIDCEETSLNSHAIKRHPEAASWTSERYDASGYKLRADAAKQALQGLITAKGIDYIELNPHRGSSGAFDNRVDAYGRYIAMVYGGGECFNAALVELGHADVYLHEDGKYLVPEMELKDFFSYAGAHRNSIEETIVTLASLDVDMDLFEALTALAYAAGGWIWSLGEDSSISFRPGARPDRVVFFDPVEVGVALGSRSDFLTNVVYFEGNPAAGSLNKTYARSASVNEFGTRAGRMNFYALSLEEDADRLVTGLLDDLAYPAPAGSVVFFRGDASIEVGDIVEVRGGQLRRLERRVSDEWGNRFGDRLVGRVKTVRHRISGKTVRTTAELASPLRSVEDPMSYVLRSQPSASALFQFRLDDLEVGLDLGYHLD